MSGAISIKENRINISDFEDLYGPQVRSDIAYVEELTRRFKKTMQPHEVEGEKVATIFEAIVYKEGEMSEWFGPHIEAILPSEYDDLKGVDLILENQNPDRGVSHIALTIDAAVSSGSFLSSSVNKKFERIKHEIDHGEFARIKYFKSERMGICGELARVPRVVVGAESKTILKLNELSLERKEKELGRHPIQFQILEEILEQAKVFKMYAERIKQPNVAGAYEKTEEIIREILREKESMVKDDGVRDGTHFAIQNALYMFK